MNVKTRNSSIAIEAILRDHPLPLDELEHRTEDYLDNAVELGWIRGQDRERYRWAMEQVATALMLPRDKLAQVRRHLVRLNAWQTPPAKIS